MLMESIGGSLQTIPVQAIVIILGRSGSRWQVTMTDGNGTKSVVGSIVILLMFFIKSRIYIKIGLAPKINMSIQKINVT